MVRALNWELIGRRLSPADWRDGVDNHAKTKTEPWGAKHPGTSLMMPTLLREFPDAEIIWCLRDLADTVDSWCRMNPEEARWEIALSVNYRHWAIAYALGYTRRKFLGIEMTNRLGEDHIVQGLGEYLGLKEL